MENKTDATYGTYGFNTNIEVVGKVYNVILSVPGRNSFCFMFSKV